VKLDGDAASSAIAAAAYSAIMRSISRARLASGGTTTDAGRIKSVSRAVYGVAQRTSCTSSAARSSGTVSARSAGSRARRMQSVPWRAARALRRLAIRCGSSGPAAAERAGAEPSPASSASRPTPAVHALLVAAGELPDPLPPQIEELAWAYLERFPPDVKA
jgi:hypothetical protein